MAILKVYDGSSWVVAIPKTYDGSAFTGLAKFYDGTDWVHLAQLVVLVGGAFAASSLAPDDAVCQYRLLSSGSEQRNYDGSWVTLGTWLREGSASDYEVRYSPTGDTGAMSGAAINTWLNAGTSRTWAITDSTVTGGSESVTGPVELRKAGSATVLASETLTLTATQNL